MSLNERAKIVDEVLKKYEKIYDVKFDYMFDDNTIYTDGPLQEILLNGSAKSIDSERLEDRWGEDIKKELYEKLKLIGALIIPFFPDSRSKFYIVLLEVYEK